MGAIDTSGDWTPHPRVARVWIKQLVTREMNPGLTVNLVRVPPGAEITLHTHDGSTETFYILAGRGVCRIGAEEFALAPGVCAHAPPGIPHTVRSTGDTELEALAIFNPPVG